MICKAWESDCWGNHPEKEVLEALEDYNKGRKRALRKTEKEDGSDQKESSSKIVEDEDNTEDERDEEESSSEDGDEGGIGFDELEDDESSSDDGVEVNMSSHRRNSDSEEDEQTISQIFDDLYYYRSLEIK